MYPIFLGSGIEELGLEGHQWTRFGGQEDLPRGLGQLGHGAPRCGKVGKSWFLIGSGCWGFGG